MIISSGGAGCSFGAVCGSERLRGLGVALPKPDHLLQILVWSTAWKPVATEGPVAMLLDLHREDLLSREREHKFFKEKASSSGLTS